MEYVLPTTDSLVEGHYYIVKGSSGTITYDGNTYNIDETLQATDEADYTVNSGDAYLTEQFRFYGASIEAARQIDERLDSVNELPDFRFRGASIEARRQRDEIKVEDQIIHSGISLEFHPPRYITTLKRRKYQE